MTDTPLGISGLDREKLSGKSSNTKSGGNKPVTSPKQPMPSRQQPKSQEQPQNSVGQEFFTAFCTRMAHLTGSSIAFVGAFGLIAVWLISGPLFHFSDTWQLVINTGTTIITFLMVFLIQNTQNRDSEALHLKLDALLLTSPDANNVLIDLEELSQEDLEALKQKISHFAGDKAQAKQFLEQGEVVTNVQEEGNSVGESPSRFPKNIQPKTSMTAKASG